MLVTAGSDLYAREIQARISTPQDTLDARHGMTEAKLEVMKLPPRRLKNQMRDSDLPSDINTPSKRSASPTRGTNVTSGRYGQRLEPCFPTLLDQNEDDMTFL